MTPGLSQARLRAVEAVAFTQLDDEAVLLHVETGVYYGLNPIGTRVWNLLLDGATEAELCTALLAEYDAEPKQLAADVAGYLAHLQAEGLIQTVGERTDLDATRAGR